MPRSKENKLFRRVLEALKDPRISKKERDEVVLAVSKYLRIPGVIVHTSEFAKSDSTVVAPAGIETPVKHDIVPKTPDPRIAPVVEKVDTE